MVDGIIAIIFGAYDLLLKMAPYLLFGYIFSGILHVFLKPQVIAKHLGDNSYLSVIKASLFGIPLPLCSCGVIPAAISLKKEGASKGAVLSFLISTPTTGIDSIFVTYALLGPFFALYRVIASFITALVAGMSSILLSKNEIIENKKSEVPQCKTCGSEGQHTHTLLEIGKSIYTYAVNVLLKESGGWIVLGIFIGGLISYLLPESFIETYLGQGVQSIVVMFLIGIPMYICSSASIPVAAAFMLKGLSPGAAFAFLLAGPATNTVTMTVVIKELGKKSFIIYIASIFIACIVLGVGMNSLWNIFSLQSEFDHVHHHELLPHWVQIVSALALMVLIIQTHIFSKKKK